MLSLVFMKVSNIADVLKANEYQFIKGTASDSMIKFKP